MNQNPSLVIEAEFFNRVACGRLIGKCGMPSPEVFYTQDDGIRQAEFWNKQGAYGQRAFGFLSGLIRRSSLPRDNNEFRGDLEGEFGDCVNSGRWSIERRGQDIKNLLVVRSDGTPLTDRALITTTPHLMFALTTAAGIDLMNEDEAGLLLLQSCGYHLPMWLPSVIERPFRGPFMMPELMADHTVREMIREDIMRLR